MPLTASETAAVHEYVRTFDGQPHIRMAIMGARGVGKDSWINPSFVGYDPTAGDDYALHVKIADKSVQLDGATHTTPGSDPMAYSLDHYSLRHTEACLLMYDVGNPASLDEIKRYYHDFLAERQLHSRYRCLLTELPVCPPGPTPYPGYVRVLANKIDGARRVPEEDGRAFANSIGADFASISVKTGEGSDRESREDLAMNILMRRIQNVAVLQDDGHFFFETTHPIVTPQNARFWY